MRPPPRKPLCVDKALRFSNVDLELIKAYLVEKGTLSKNLIRELISQTKNIFLKDPNTLKIDGDVVIIGDIHGQFMDMMGMFDKLKREPGKKDT